MIARLFALKLFAAILLTSCAATTATTRANPRDLPNDCGIIAAEAFARLSGSCCWTRVIAIKAVVFHRDGKIIQINHIMVCYQYDTASHVMLYDGAGTAEIHTTSHELKDIAAGLTKAALLPMVILDARFLSS